MSQQGVTAEDVMDDGFFLQFEGRVIHFAPKDNVDVAAAYETYLKDQAWLELERAVRARLLSPQTLQDQADGIRRDVVAGVYSYGSRFWQESTRCMPHQKKLACLMAQCHDRDFDPAVIDRLYKDPARLAELVGKMFGIDPNLLMPQRTPAAA